MDDIDRIVGQWARERPDLQTEAMAVFGRIYRLAKLVGDRQEKVYVGLGVNRGEFDVLAALRRAGDPFQLPPKALSASLMLTTGGMTGRLDRLERAGLVTRSPDPDDRRGLVITLTDPGRELVDEAVGAGLAVQREVLERLPEPSRRQLATLLRELLTAAAGYGG
ncbi:MarR family transcriptional regulator [Dactylosporangium fulvum]|uniref:MarR family transcriptional regulator n=1 Tax=Dactylosporangium fulvum TaxID=53359 RepID=A0ABY5W4I3_9ACTN|nr:MarR family transcriptional regulator [Dactylosporangium fulvum]UWP84967.1 MarR family transcriptional regulator [Dactylosporangium fulvum]